MNLKVVACKGGPCPTIYETDRGTYVVQGRAVAISECQGAGGLGPEERLVEIPADLVASLVERLRNTTSAA